MHPEIQTKNKLLAEYMGFTYYPHDKGSKTKAGWAKRPFYESLTRAEKLGLDTVYLCRTHNQLRFHYDWNWLMPVVQKIHKDRKQLDSLSWAESHELLMKLSLPEDEPLCIFNLCSGYVELQKKLTFYEQLTK